MAGSKAAPTPNMELDGDEYEGVIDVGVNSDDDDDAEVLDLSGYSDTGSFKLIPNGTYDAIITNIEYVAENSKGMPMLTWTLQITTGEFKGRKLKCYTTLDDADPDKKAGMLGRLRRYILVASPEFNIRALRVKELGVELANRPVAIKVGQNVYQNEKRNQVNDLLPPRATTSDLADIF